MALIDGDGRMESSLAEHCVDAQSLEWSDELVDDGLSRYTTAYAMAAMDILRMTSGSSNVKPSEWLVALEALVDDVALEASEAIDAADDYDAVDSWSACVDRAFSNGGRHHAQAD